MGAGVSIVMNGNWSLFLLILATLGTNCAAVANNSPSGLSSYLVSGDISTLNQAVESSALSSETILNKSIVRSAGVYFDTPEFQLLENGAFLRFDAIEYLSKKKNKSKFQETVHYSSKRHPNYKMGVKHYNSVKTFEGKHPLLGVIKRKERSAFLAALESDGIPQPLRLKELSKLSRVSSVYKLSAEDIDLGELVVSEIRLEAFGRQIDFNMINIQLTAGQLSDPHVISFSSSLLKALSVSNDKAFDNEYELVYSQLESQVLFFKWLLKYPFLVNLFYSIAIGFLGALVIWWVYKTREKKQALL